MFYVIGINNGAVMDLTMIKSKNEFDKALKEAKKQYQFLTIYTGVIDLKRGRGDVVWDK